MECVSDCRSASSTLDECDSVYYKEWWDARTRTCCERHNPLPWCVPSVCDDTNLCTPPQYNCSGYDK
jgi:hypothetical protein